MSRSLRIEYPGAFYHVTARGNERKAIFKATENYEKFIGYLESATERYGSAALGSNLYSWLLLHWRPTRTTYPGNILTSVLTALLINFSYPPTYCYKIPMKVLSRATNPWIEMSYRKRNRLLLMLPFFEMERSGRVFRQDSNQRRCYSEFYKFETISNLGLTRRDSMPWRGLPQPTEVDVSISFDFYGPSS